MTNDDDPTARVAHLAEVVILHRESGASEDQVRKLPSWQELAQLAPDHHLVRSNRSERIDELEHTVRLHQAAQTPNLEDLPSYRELLTIHPTSRVIRGY